MTIDPLSTLQNPALQGPAAAAGPQDQTFDAALQQARDAGFDGRFEELREASEKLVASAFILPLLEQVRASAKEHDMFHGGTGEDLFAQQLDTRIADDIVKSTRLPIVDAIHEQFARTAGLGKQVSTHG